MTPGDDNQPETGIHVFEVGPGDAQGAQMVAGGHVMLTQYRAWPRPSPCRREGEHRRPRERQQRLTRSVVHENQDQGEQADERHHEGADDASAGAQDHGVRHSCQCSDLAVPAPGRARHATWWMSHGLAFSLPPPSH